MPGNPLSSKILYNSSLILNPAYFQKSELATMENNTVKQESVKRNFPVLNMSCASCAASSQSTLENLPGVLNASVNYANGTALVEYLPKEIDPADMQKALQSVGYDLMIEADKDSSDHLQQIEEQQYKKLRSKTFAAIALSVPLVLVGMVFMSMPYADYIMWALATPIVFIFGRQFFVGAWKQLKHFRANMDTLVAMSTGIAYFFSVFNILFPTFWTSRGIVPHVYFEAAGVIIAFILVGKLLEARAKGSTSSAIKKLIGLQPNTVSKIAADGSIVTCSVKDVEVGDELLIKPGEKVAVDGKVTSGNSFVDESMISGEPVAVEKMPGSAVFAGTINQKGSFRFTAEKVGSNTLLAQIIDMVRDAQGSRAPVQKLVDKIAGIFVPVVIVISLISLILWIIFGGNSGLVHGLLAMVTVLVIACPCALGLATPTAIMVGMGKGAENGILIKDAESLERAKKVNALVLDKTGTITEGKPVMADQFWLDDQFQKEFVSLEKISGHPLADAVVEAFPENYEDVSQFENIPGAGVAGMINGKKYFAGNRKLIRENRIRVPVSIETKAEAFLNRAYTIIYFADAENVIAIIGITDKIKDSAAEAIRQLKEEDIEMYLLTGDHLASANAVGKLVGIESVKGEMLPENKRDFVKQLQDEGKIVAMVGDGINDSAALAQADISIAMGKGSDVALDVARMAIISDDLRKIPQAFSLSRLTVATIRQNLFWAFIYNVIGIPLAAGILYPVNGFLLNPMIAGAAMALSSVSVVTNSLRLKTKKLKN